MNEDYRHEPVLLEEAVNALSVNPDGLYIDCTTGGGGHSSALAAKLDFNRGGRLICFDKDEAALKAAGLRLSQYPAVFVNADFADLKSELENLNITAADGVLMDLGVSSHQLDSAERGFSFHKDAPLDMRMDSRAALSAYDVVNGYGETELIKILFEYGEEKYARGITRGIITARTNTPVKTTSELAEIIKRNVPLSVRNAKNPCRKTFQAIRMEVNNELGSLEKGLHTAFEVLSNGGKLAIITFHSLEDRLVKNAFREYASGCDCPKSLPVCVCGKTPRGKTSKPVTPRADEIARNPRSRSAKLRVIEKLR